MMGGTASRFTPEGDWREVGSGERAMATAVSSLAEDTFRCHPLRATPTVQVPESLRQPHPEQSPVPLIGPPCVTQVRHCPSEGLIDFLGSMEIEGDPFVLHFLATLRDEGRARYSLWSPVSLVP